MLHPQGARRRRRLRGEVGLRQLSFMLLFAIITLVFALGAHPAYGAEDLSAILLPAETVNPGAAIDMDDVLTGADLYDEPGAVGDIKRLNVVAGVARRYTTRDSNTVIMLVEYRNNEWANDPVLHVMDEDAPEFGPGVRRARGEDDGLAFEAASLAKGRINIQVWVVSRHAGSNGLVHEQLRHVLQAQESRVPSLPDLDNDENSPLVVRGQQFATRWGSVSALIVVLFAIWGQAVAAFRDRGSREWMRHHWFRSPGQHPRITLTDVTREVRNRGPGQMATWALRTLGMAGALGLLLAHPQLSVWAALAILAIAITLLSVASALFAQGKAQTGDAQGRWPGVVMGIGAAASGILLFIGVVFMSAAVSGWFLYERLTALQIIIPMTLFGLSLMGSSRKPIRFTRRILQPLVREQIQSDARRPILLLRSFQDDSLEVRSPAMPGSFIDTFAGEVFSRFEEVIAWSAWGFGPVLAIGQPGTILQPLGAARDYFSDDDWQTAVDQRAENARAIVVVVGRSPGLVWEIQNIRQHNRLAKAVFILPPVSPHESQVRKQVLASALDLDPSILDVGLHRMPLALRFDECGQPTLYICGGRTGTAYAEALGRALADISPIVSTLSSPAEDVRQPGADVANLLQTFDPANVAQPKQSVISRLSDIALHFVPS
ncbi:MAG: hypothetical protein U1E29_02560 [Coriobacteriia bacterium]|nr:hypothetical protein [Coriobacteriia bacterium]